MSCILRKQCFLYMKKTQERHKSDVIRAYDFHSLDSIHLSNVLTNHLNILAYIKSWLLPNNKIKYYFCIILRLRKFILEDILQIMITSEQYSTHNIERNHTTPKTKVTMTHFYDASQLQCFFPTCKSSKFLIWTLWTCISGFEYFVMTLTSTETTLIKTLLCMFGRSNIPKTLF